MSSSSRDRSPFPEEVFVEDLNLTRSNDLVELDAPPITMTLADQDHVKGLVAFYTTSKIRHRTYPERTWEIIPWIKRYDLTDNLNDPCGDFHTILSHINDPVLHPFPVGRMDEREVDEYCSNTTKWFKSDHLSFYTDWSQMYDSRYDDSHDVFSFFTTSGEMTSWSSGSTKAVLTLMTPTSMLPGYAPASGSEFVHQVTYYTARRKLRLVRTRMVMIQHLSEG
jgi:hypothetical protein